MPLCGCQRKMCASILIERLVMAVLCIVVPVSTLQTVTTDVGSFVGFSDNAKYANGVSRFLGIPYAKPPTGERRFARPVSAAALTSTYNATYHRAHCPQTEAMFPAVKYYNVSEDCLHLNIYVPGTRVSANTSYAVMIWIYGGGFKYGGADIYYGDAISSQHGVIVVTLNYRLNLFGFLSDGTRSTGNLGLWDQKLALEWVHKHIGAFGGDVNRVTLFGQSAGAVSVMYQALNPANQGLFSRVIAQSGSPLAPWAVNDSPADSFDALCARVSCGVGDWACLKGKTMDELLSSILPDDSFSPVVDSDFIKEHPKLLFSNTTAASKAALKHFGKLDFLSGVTNKDGTSAITYTWGGIMKEAGLDINMGVPRSFFELTFLPATLSAQMNGQAPPMPLVSAVKHEYTDWSNPRDPSIIRDKMIDMSTDVLFLVPAVIAANKHSESARKHSKNTYFYQFDHKPVFAPLPLWLNGAKHTMEIPYVFGMVDSLKVALGIPPTMDMPLTIPLEDMSLSLLISTMWTDFAKHGTPTPGDSSQWPAYDTETGQYRHLSTSPAVGSHIGAESRDFWTDLVPVLSSQSGGCSSKPVKKQSQETTPTSSSPTLHVGAALLAVSLVLFSSAQIIY